MAVGYRIIIFPAVRDLTLAELLVMLYLTQYNNGLRIVHIFFRLWIFPFGCLVVKPGFLPEISEVLLMPGCLNQTYRIFYEGLMTFVNRIQLPFGCTPIAHKYLLSQSYSLFLTKTIFVH